VYNESGRLIGRYDESGNAIREYFRMGGTPVAVASNDGLYYIHSDHLGTPRAVSQPNGGVVWSWISDAFGSPAPNVDPDGDGETFTLNLRFAGQYFDAETNLHQNVWREYDPVAGRYTTPDPIGLAGGMNPYLYANANPTKFIDRNGLSPSMMDRFRDMANFKPGPLPDMALIVREFGQSAGDAIRCRDHFCKLKRVPVRLKVQEWCIMNASGNPVRCADFFGAITYKPKGVRAFKKECVSCKD